MEQLSIGKETPAITMLAKMIVGMQKNEKEYLMSFVNDFYSSVKPVATLNVNLRYKLYLLKLIRMDYDERLIGIKFKFGAAMASYMRNVFIAKLRTTEIKIRKEIKNEESYKNRTNRSQRQK